MTYDEYTIEATGLQGERQLATRIFNTMIARHAEESKAILAEQDRITNAQNALMKRMIADHEATYGAGPGQNPIQETR